MPMLANQCFGTNGSCVGQQTTQTGAKIKNHSGSETEGLTGKWPNKPSINMKRPNGAM